MNAKERVYAVSVSYRCVCAGAPQSPWCSLVGRLSSYFLLTGSRVSPSQGLLRTGWQLLPGVGAAAAGALCGCLSAGGSRPGCSQSPWGRRQWPPVSVCTLAPLWLKASLHLKPCRTVFCTRPICAGKFDKIYWEENCLFDLNTGCLLIQFKLVTPVFLAFDIFRHFMWFFNGYFCELWFFSTKYF